MVLTVEIRKEIIFSEGINLGGRMHRNITTKCSDGVYIPKTRVRPLCVEWQFDNLFQLFSRTCCIPLQGNSSEVWYLVQGVKAQEINVCWDSTTSKMLSHLRLSGGSRFFRNIGSCLPKL